MNEYERMWRRLYEVLDIHVVEYHNAEAFMDYEHLISVETVIGIMKEMKAIENEIKGSE